MDESRWVPRINESPRTSGMDEQRVRALVKELDALVPRAENEVRVMDGPDALEVVATRAGALRLGVAILRAAVEERSAHSSRSDAEAELDALIDPDGDTWIESVFIERELPVLEPAEDENEGEEEDAGYEWNAGVLATIVWVLLAIGFSVVVIAGVATVIAWIGDFLSAR